MTEDSSEAEQLREQKHRSNPRGSPVPYQVRRRAQLAGVSSPTRLAGNSRGQPLWLTQWLTPCAPLEASGRPSGATTKPMQTCLRSGRFPGDFVRHVSIEGWGKTRFGWYLGRDNGSIKGDGALNAWQLI
jgi:hypothetical protein